LVSYSVSPEGLLIVVLENEVHLMLEQFEPGVGLEGTDQNKVFLFQIVKLQITCVPDLRSIGSDFRHMIQSRGKFEVGERSVSVFGESLKQVPIAWLFTIKL
jgi:hypothetical protein